MPNEALAENGTEIQNTAATQARDNAARVKASREALGQALKQNAEGNKERADSFDKAVAGKTKRVTNAASLATRPLSGEEWLTRS